MQSRNQREGRYAGKFHGMHFRTRENYKFLPPPQTVFVMRRLADKMLRLMRLQRASQPSTHQNQSSL